MRGDVPSHSCEGRGTESHDGMGGGGISWLTGEAKQGKQGRKGWFVPSSALPECQSLPTSRQTVKEKGVLLPTPHNFPSPSPPPLSLERQGEGGKQVLSYCATPRLPPNPNTLSESRVLNYHGSSSSSSSFFLPLSPTHPSLSCNLLFGVGQRKVTNDST